MTVHSSLRTYYGLCCGPLRLERFRRPCLLQQCSGLFVLVRLCDYGNFRDVGVFFILRGDVM